MKCYVFTEVKIGVVVIWNRTTSWSPGDVGHIFLHGVIIYKTTVCVILIILF